MNGQNRWEILLVEDSPEDYEVTVRAFRKAHFDLPLRWCETGDDALDYLYQRRRYASPGSAPRPSLVLLDLNLPGTDGREVLQQIKADPNLRTIPVIVLTTSTDQRDIESCYRAGANCYIPKPLSLDTFVRFVRILKIYWFELAVLPWSPAFNQQVVTAQIESA